MVWVLLLVIGLISYGSLYPFGFVVPSEGVSWIDLAGSMLVDRSSRGDIFQNVMLFVPYGACAVLSFDARRPAAVRIGVTVVTGLAIAFALQVGQVFLPQRTASLADVGWNGVGLGLGAAAGIAASRLAGPGRAGRLGRLGDARLGTALVPAGLIGLWVAVRLFPFVPSIDLQMIKDNLKPLLLRPEVTFFGTFENLVGWLLALSFWRDVSGDARADRAALPVIAAVLAVQPIIVSNPLRAHEVLGALLAMAAWWGWLADRPRRAEGLATLLLCLLLLQGLSPLQLRAEPAPFGWVPFIGSFGGSIMANMLAMTSKVFFYGAAVRVLAACGAHTLAAALAVAVLLFLIELAQTNIGTRTPEITDPVLALLIGIGFRLVDPANGTVHRALTPAAPGR